MNYNEEIVSAVVIDKTLSMNSEHYSSATKQLLKCCSQKTINRDRVLNLIESTDASVDATYDNGDSILHRLVTITKPLSATELNHRAKCYRIAIKYMCMMPVNELLETVLIRSVFTNDPKLVELVLDYDEFESVNQTDQFGNSALHYAVEIKNNPIIALIVSAGARFDLINKASETPAMMIDDDRDFAQQIAVDYPESLFTTKAVVEMTEIPDHAESNYYVKQFLLNSAAGAMPLRLASRAILENLSELRERFPAMTEVIDFVGDQICLSVVGQTVIKLPPILLHGEPGTGKTCFLKALSKALLINFAKIDCPTLTNSFVLAGSSSTWQGAKLGRFAEILLANGSMANSLVALDELDKITATNSDPYGSLYNVLESSSDEFVDEYLETPIDLGGINWFCTANDISQIPDPIFSRLTPFKIERPKKELMPKVIQSIYTDLIVSNSIGWGGRLKPTLDQSIVAHLTSFTPREIKQRLLEAIGRKARTIVSRSLIISPKTKINLTIKEFDSKINRVQKKIGFC